MKWGVIGSRGYAAKSAIPGISASKRGELVAVLGRDQGRAEELAREHGAAPSTDLEEFLATPGMEAVWITSPTWLHHEHTIAALKAGHDVLCEKPLAASSADAWDMVEAARGAGKLLATGYQGRYVPGHQEMARLISQRAIGDITMARTYYGLHRPRPPSEWRQKKQTARWGTLSNIGTHHIDLLRMLLGEVTEAHCIAGHQLGFETEDVAAASLRFESGVLATLTATENVWIQSTRVEIHGTSGALVATDTHPDGQGDVVLFEADNPAGKDLTGTKPASVWAAQIDAVTATASGEDIAYATGEDGARNIDILEALVPP